MKHPIKQIKKAILPRPDGIPKSHYKAVCLLDPEVGAKIEMADGAKYEVAWRVTNPEGHVVDWGQPTVLVMTMPELFEAAAAGLAEQNE